MNKLFLFPLLCAGNILFAQDSYNWYVGVHAHRTQHRVSPQLQTYSTYNLQLEPTYLGPGIMLGYSFNMGKTTLNYDVDFRYGVVRPGDRHSTNSRLYPTVITDSSQIIIPATKWGILTDHWVTFSHEKMRILNQHFGFGLGMHLIAVHPAHRQFYDVHDGHHEVYRTGSFSYIVPGMHIDVSKFFWQRVSAHLRVMYHPVGWIQYYPNDRLIGLGLSILYHYNYKKPVVKFNLSTIPQL